MPDGAPTSSTRLARRVRRHIQHLQSSKSSAKTVIGTWLWTYDPPDKVTIKGERVIDGMDEWLTHEITENGLNTDKRIENHHLRHKDIDICLSGHPTSNGGMIGSITVLQLTRPDISAPNWQKRMNDWPVPAMALDQDDQLLSANKAFYAEFFTDDPGRIHRGMPVGQLFPDTDLGVLDTTIDDQAYHLLSLSHRGGRVVVFSRHQKSVNGDGNAVALSRMGDDFYDRLGHELRTPLNAIIGFSQVMEDMVDNNPQLIEFIGDIHDSGHRLNVLLDDMVTWLKMDRQEIDFKQQSVQLGKALATSLRKYRELSDDKSITIQWNFDGEQIDAADQLLIDLPGDEVMFQQLFNKFIHHVLITSEVGQEIALTINQVAGYVDIIAVWTMAEDQITWADLRLAIMNQILDQNDGRLVDETGQTPARLTIRLRGK
jgi:signal transduction histidine kinase